MILLIWSLGTGDDAADDSSCFCPKALWLRRAEMIMMCFRADWSEGDDSDDTVTGRTEKSGYLLVELNNKSVRDQWLSAAKTKEITVGDISLPVPVENATNRVYVREALTRSKKTLLYQAKQRLKALNGPFKYVWCKEGKLYVKKTDNSTKVQIIRSVCDIDLLLASKEI
ncbi:hypothetical protein ACJJTC_012317 [Scirpophaga incertulas]